MIDWTRVAAPQEDGYDTDVVLQHAATTKYKEPPAAVGNLIWPTGRARWTKLPTMPASSFADMDPTDGKVSDGLRMLKLWPAVEKQCSEILAAIAPMTLGLQGGHGCSCGNYNDDFGWIYVTADDPWGFAEGIVHEMGHWKLRALGIWFEEWTPLLLENKPEELYDSPVRKDKQRPMGAVLHGQYSYVHVAEMVLRMCDATRRPVGWGDLDWLEVQVKRITEGQATVRAHARGTAEGRSFLEGLDKWTTDVISRSTAMLKEVS